MKTQKIKRISLIQSSILAAVLAVAVLAVLPARAQLNYKPVPVLLKGGTNNVPAASTNSYAGAEGNLIDVRGQSTITFLFKQKGGDVGTGNSTLYFDQSLDRKDWGPFASQDCPFAGTTTTTNFFTFSVKGIGWLRVNQLGNTNSIYGTNLFLEYALKTGLK